MNGPTCIRCGQHHKTADRVPATNETTDCLQAQIAALTARLAEAESDLLKLCPWRWKGTLGDAEVVIVPSSLTGQEESRS